MLDITSFGSYGFSLAYHGANEYLISEYSGHFALTVDVMDEYGECKIGEQKFSCSSVSSAIAIIEAMENGEEV